MDNMTIVCEEELLLALLRYLPCEETYLGGEEDEGGSS